MNAESNSGMKGGKKTAASSKSKAAPKSKKGIFKEEDTGKPHDKDYFQPDHHPFDKSSKGNKQSGKKNSPFEDEFLFEDNLSGFGFLEDSFYDEDEEELY